MAVNAIAAAVGAGGKRAIERGWRMPQSPLADSWIEIGVR